MDIPDFLFEGFRLDHDGTMLYTVYVDLREPNERHPIPMLVKGCRSEHVAHPGSRIKLTAPHVFQENGGSLILDESEGRIIEARREEEAEHINDPQDIALAREMARKQLQRVANEFSNILTLKVTDETITTRSRVTDTEIETINFAPKGWLFCASACPTTPEEWDAWQSSLEPDYDSKYSIYRPREFAGALAQMVAGQMGPHGRNNPLESSWSGLPPLQSLHPTQGVMHGPVVYKDDVLEWLKDARTAAEYLFRAVFTKHSTHRDQREYRFFVQSEKYLGQDCYLLDVSPALLSATAIQAGDPSPPVFYKTDQTDGGVVRDEGEPNPLRVLLSSNPPVPVRVGRPDASAASPSGIR